MRSIYDDNCRNMKHTLPFHPIWQPFHFEVKTRPVRHSTLERRFQLLGDTGSDERSLITTATLVSVSIHRVESRQQPPLYWATEVLTIIPTSNRDPIARPQQVHYCLNLLLPKQRKLGNNTWLRSASRTSPCSHTMDQNVCMQLFNTFLNSLTHLSNHYLPTHRTPIIYYYWIGIVNEDMSTSTFSSVEDSKRKSIPPISSRLFMSCIFT